MNSNMTVTATFTEVSSGPYILTVNTAGSGSVGLDPSGGTYAAGTSVQLTADPADGWEFSGWSGDLAGNTNPVSVSMNSNMTVTATFTDSSACAPLDARFVQATLVQGLAYYTDRAYTLTNVPSAYAGMNAILTPNDDRYLTAANGYLTFGMPSDGTVYVAYDSRATSLPDWMDGFVDTGASLLTSLSSQPALKIYSQPFFEGDCINLGGNMAPGWAGYEYMSNYIVFTGTTVPEPCAQLDARFDEATLVQGLAYYTDRGYTLTNVPSAYAGMNAILTPNDDRYLTAASGYLTFGMPSDGTVYVAYDSRATSLPNWMGGFVDTGASLLTSLSSQPALKIYSQPFFEGDCINLGGNMAPGWAGYQYMSNYIVFYE